MGCTVRDKHIKTSRRARLMKPTSSDVDHDHLNDRSSSLAKSMLESGLKPWTYNMGSNDSGTNFNRNGSGDNGGSNDGSNPNGPANSSTAQTPSFDDCGWGYCTEEQLEELLLQHMECLYSNIVSKIVALGYDEEVVLQAILRNGHCYGGLDVLANIVNNALAYLDSGCCSTNEHGEEAELGFTELKQMEEYTLEGMIYLLKQVRPHLSRGDAMWCLLMSDLQIGRASTIDIPMLPSPSNVPGNAMGNMDLNVSGIDLNLPASTGISVPPGLHKFHGGWGFGNGGSAEIPGNGMGGMFSYSETGIPEETDCAKRFSFNPSVKSSLNRTAPAACSRSKQQLQQTPSQPCASSTPSGDPPKVTVSKGDVPKEVSEESRDVAKELTETKAIVNSVLTKLRNLNLDDNFESVTEDQKDEIILNLLHQIKDLEKQVSERREWAHQKAMQAARKLSSDLTELKILRMEGDETQRLKKGKQTLEDTTMKRLSEMENALRKASSQVDRANAAVRQLEVENAEIRAEMEASKLSASESVTTCLEVAKREKKCLKRLLAWEKQKTKLQEEIAAEKRKITGLQQQLGQIDAAQKEAEAKWKEEVKEKELAMTLVDEERRSKEATEGENKRKLEALRLRIEIDFQRHKDDLQRLEQELSRLKASTEPNDSSDSFTGGSPEVAKDQRDSIARFLRELDEPEGEGSERECIVCMQEEVSVVFLPCAHQVMCAGCGENCGKKGKATCPCCRVPIEQKILVFGASS